MMDGKKIVFNATIISSKPTGVGIYSINMLNRLLNKHIIDCIIFSNDSEQKKYSDKYPNIQVDGYYIKSRQLASLFRNVKYTSIIKKLSLANDLILYSPTAHGIINSSMKQIITIHDLMPLLYPRGRTHQYLYHKFILPFIIKSSEIVITDSQNTKNDLIKYYNINESKIKVIHCGCNLPKTYDRAVSIDYIENKYKIKNYILMVGIHYEYKNLHSVINALKIIEKDINKKLVIVGNNQNLYGKKLIKLAEKLKLSDKVIFLGYVEEEELDRLYQAAKAFIYPSLYEGFGLPPLEAMANGTPVICSNQSSLPEVIGDAAITFNPNSIIDICEKIKKLCNMNEMEIENLIEKGHKNLERFSWNKASNEVSELILTLK